MTITALTPIFTEPQQFSETLRGQGFGVFSPEGFSRFIGQPLSSLKSLQADWNDLPLDNFLKDGGHYRRRRHSSFVTKDTTLKQVPHRAHYQPLEYNALHGGMHRMFQPITQHTLTHPAWTQLLLGIARVCSSIKGEQPWYVEAHQFRIDTSNGIGRPTPEGAHRDGVDFVAILLVDRVNIKGGESRIFAADGPHGQRFTLFQPWTLLILDDQRVLHETTPIQPTAAGGYRDTLVLTYRAGGFLEEV
jgi:hypothetical protein